MQIYFSLQKECCHYEARCEPHFHDEYEILLGITDGGTYVINGHSYPLCHGMLFVLGKGVIHQCIANISSYEKYIIHFSQETLQLLSSAQTDLPTLFNNFDYLALLLNEDQFDQFRRGIEACLSNTGAFGEDLRRNIAFMNLLLDISELVKGSNRSVSPALSQEYAKMMPIFEYIHQHYGEDIGLEDLSSRFYISKYYLCRQFKALTGFSVGAYITNYRIRQACILLRKGVSVQQAGEEVGFGSTAHFINTFGKIIGISPGRYAKTY